MPGDGTAAQRRRTTRRAKAKAEEIRKRVRLAGESFEKLAAELSDAPSKANGGLIGPLSVDDLSPELRKLIEPMKPGDISRAAAHAARLSDPEARNRRRRPQTMPFEQAREQISDRVFTDKRQGGVRRSISRSCARRRSSSGRTTR